MEQEFDEKLMFFGVASNDLQIGDGRAFQYKS